MVGRSPGKPVEILDLLADASTSQHDPGLAVLAHLVLADPSAPLGVVTGSADAEHLKVLPGVRTRVASLSVARVGGQFEEAALSLPGILAVSGRDSAALVARWNQLMRR